VVFNNPRHLFWDRTVTNASLCMVLHPSVLPVLPSCHWAGSPFNSPSSGIPLSCLHVIECSFSLEGEGGGGERTAGRRRAGRQKTGAGGGRAAAWRDTTACAGPTLANKQQTGVCLFLGYRTTTSRACLTPAGAAAWRLTSTLPLPAKPSSHTCGAATRRLGWWHSATSHPRPWTVYLHSSRAHTDSLSFSVVCILSVALYRYDNLLSALVVISDQQRYTYVDTILISKRANRLDIAALISSSNREEQGTHRNADGRRQHFAAPSLSRLLPTHAVSMGACSVHAHNSARDETRGR